MRNLLIVCVMLVVAVLAVNTASAVDKAIPQATLQAMGLSGVQTVTDAQGDAIRGKGTILIQASYATVRFGHASATAVSGQLYASDKTPDVIVARTTPLSTSIFVKNSSRGHGRH